MLEAGFDEMTHINQYMLGWVIEPTEDTRTLFRLTALKRLPGLDLDSAKVRRTIDLTVAPRAGGRDAGHPRESAAQPRRAGAARCDGPCHAHADRHAARHEAVWINTSAPGDDAAYRGACAKIVATIALLDKRGVTIVPGTDTGGSFTYHRGLELYQSVGSVGKGKLADFFLVPGDPAKNLKAIKRIAMVVKDGQVHVPAEVCPEFGIQPFAPAPKVAPARP